ncbi:TPA: hypothetical protein U2I64_000710 [Providencia stuartii]|uniref:Uncharacterized protein n=1 Tax=Providencia stuartii ATCC 25827 TaxID=471874 RepID=A0AA86YLL0_PROST|nr:hypothetical protein PROSTU_03399 [Providencia stuartii ATCC 25827]HEM7172055.1 hypothetical protein [Providencia stuartii]
MVYSLSVIYFLMFMWSLSSRYFLQNSEKIGPAVVAARTLTESSHSNADAAVSNLHY